MKNPFTIEADPQHPFESEEWEGAFETLSEFEEEEAPSGGAVTTPSRNAPISSISLGVDYFVGDGNRNPNWVQAKAKIPIDFAIIQSNLGLWENPNFKLDWSRMKDAGIVRGAYLFLRFPHPKNNMRAPDPASQARAFIKTVGNLDESDLPPSFDVEF